MFTGKDLISWVQTNHLEDNPMMIIDSDIKALKKDYIVLAMESSFNETINNLYSYKSAMAREK